MIAIDFSRAKAVCAVRYANFTADCCKYVVSAPHLGLLEGERMLPGGNDLGQRKRPTGSNPEPAAGSRNQALGLSSRRTPGLVLSYECAQKLDSRLAGFRACLRGIIAVVPAEAGTQWRSARCHNARKGTGSRVRGDDGSIARSVTFSRSSPGRSLSRILASHRASVAQNRRLQSCLRSPSPGS